MKKILMLIVLAAFLFGCGASATQSEFWKHDTMYRTNDHMFFSMSGYSNPTREDQKRSMEQGWWGIEIPYIPAR
jgi:hypothetical protein